MQFGLSTRRLDLDKERMLEFCRTDLPKIQYEIFATESHRAGKNKNRSQKLLKPHPPGITGRGELAYTASLPNL